MAADVVEVWGADALALSLRALADHAAEQMEPDVRKLIHEGQR